jgi:hypothetical protein
MANRKTRVTGKIARYTNRNMPAKLLHDMKLEAVRRKATMEEICNEALKLGLKEMRRLERAPTETGGVQPKQETTTIAAGN